jgi:HEAT repeat protein
MKTIERTLTLLLPALLSAATATAADPTDSVVAPDALIEVLRKEHDGARQRALDALAADPALRERYEPVLRQALADDDRRVRLPAAIALAGFGIADQAVLDELTRALGMIIPPRYSVRPEDPQAAQWALEKLGRKAVAALAAVAADKEHGGRWLAIEALGTIGPEAADALPALQAVLRERDDPNRHHAIEAKWRIDGDAAFAVRELVPLLDTERGRDCNGAVRVLVRMGADAKDAVPDIIRAMRRYKDYNLVWALGELAPHARQLAVPALIDALDDPELAADAAGALPGLGVGAEVIVPPLVRLLEQTDDGDSELYGLAVALEPYGPDAWPAVPTLVRLLKHPNVVVRGPATEMLGKLGPRARGAIAPLTEALGDPYTAEEAAQALARIVGGE